MWILRVTQINDLLDLVARNCCAVFRDDEAKFLALGDPLVARAFVGTDLVHRDTHHVNDTVSLFPPAPYVGSGPACEEDDCFAVEFVVTWMKDTVVCHALQRNRPEC